MKTTDIDNLISELKGDATLLSMVDSSNIRIGWVNVISEFPSVIITIVGDDIIQKLGYSTSPDGSKERVDTGRVQIDIYSDKSARECAVILDRITLILLQSSKFLKMRKTSDSQLFDNETRTWRRVTTWEFQNVHAD